MEEEDKEIKSDESSEAVYEDVTEESSKQN